MKKNVLYATVVLVATLTAPTAQAAVTPSHVSNWAISDILINRPIAAAEIQLVGLRPPSVASLIRLNMRIWGCVGWQWGRLETLKKYNIDIGARCPR